MNDLNALVYPSLLSRSGRDFGAEHPFKILRYRLTFELMEELGLLRGENIRLVDCQCAAEDLLATFHDTAYLHTLKEFSKDDTHRADFRFGLGDVENPVFEGCYDWARLVCGATMEAFRQVLDEGARLAFNMTGGMHHAHAARASGFSYLNDAVIGIKSVLDKGLRVAYVDLDAHHGDGVQKAFYDDDRVLTVSLHETGRDFFPHTGFTKELGRGDGYGYSINVPFEPHSDDLIFEQAFRRIVMPLLGGFKPDLLVTQLGVDGLRTDPLTRLEFTTASTELATRLFLQTGIPWVALGGGGYDKFNVARSWSAAWGIMTGRQVPDRLPSSFARLAEEAGETSKGLRDQPHLAQPDDFARAEEELKRTIRLIEQRAFPVHGLSSGEKR